ncbi:MAG: hypothetical protein EBR82_28725 [Caulobacteraceae bacterium]|nr:hypothetical protein [Caulobacteraceae bacterium]
MSENLPELTEEQQLNLLNEWNNRADNPPSLTELVKLAFGRDDLDGRSKEGKAVKQFLAARQIKPRKSHEYQAKGLIELTEDQKEYISNNCATMTGIEIAKILFKNESLTNLSQETRSVLEYMKTIPSNIKYLNDTNENAATEIYKAPRSEERMIAKINRYILDGIDKEKITPRQKKEVNSLIGYMNTYRFTHQINLYDDENDRELFESSFVRYTYDKSDLTQEEVDQYIVLATEVVISSSIQQTITTLQNQIDIATQEDGKIPMTLVEASSTARKEYNDCVNRQQKLLQDLKVKRSERLSKQVKENASILNLVEMWKQEESRQKLLKIAELRKNTIKKEIERLGTMDELKARILGISEDDILNG